MTNEKDQTKMSYEDALKQFFSGPIGFIGAVPVTCRACEIENNDEQVKQMPEHICDKRSKDSLIEDMCKQKSTKL